VNLKSYTEISLGILTSAQCPAEGSYQHGKEASASTKRARMVLTIISNSLDGICLMELVNPSKHRVKKEVVPVLN
jgi:hypothetical protein